MPIELLILQVSVLADLLLGLGQQESNEGKKSY
jgi:hypothetical protein